MCSRKIRSFVFAIFMLSSGQVFSSSQIISIKISGLSYFPDEKILTLIKSRWFLEFDSTRAWQDCEAIEQFYRDEGFLEVICQYDARVDEGKQGTRLIFNLDEGALYRFGDIELSGLNNVESHLVANLIEFSSGMPFSKSKIVQSQLRAMQTGLFADFEIKAKEVDPFEKTISVVVNIEENLTYAFDIGMGIDSEDGANVFSGWKNRNTNGEGRSIGANGLLSVNYDNALYFKKASLGLVVREPFFLELPLDALLNSSFTLDKPNYVNFGFKSYMAELIFDIPVSYEYELIIRGRLQNAQLFNIPFEQEIHSFQNRFKIDNNRFLSLTLSRDSRDDLVDPSQGSFLSVTLEKAGGFLGGDNDYKKIYFLTSFYQSIQRRLVLAQQVAAGSIDLNGDIIYLPSYLRFFLGGSGSIRGFAQRSLGPRNSDGSAAGGNFLLLGNFEIRYYLSYNLNLVTFFDAGNVWLTSSAATLSSLKCSTGIGLRLRSRFGFFRLDFGLKLSDFSTSDLGRIHFGFGQNF